MDLLKEKEKSRMRSCQVTWYWSVGSVLIGGGMALVSVATAGGWWQEFPLMIAGIFITLAGAFFVGIARKV